MYKRQVLKNVTPYFPQLVANDVYLPIKKDVVEAAGEGWEKKPETCVSNGPFMLEEYQVGSHFLFKKNPNYYDADSVKLPGVKAVIITDDNTAYQAYQAGEVDVMDHLPSEPVSYTHLRLDSGGCPRCSGRWSGWL